MRGRCAPIVLRFRCQMNVRVLPLVGLLLALAAVASAQQFDRRAREEPEIVVNAGGRIGFCDALRFDPSGEFLFAGGDDKVVTVWPVVADGKTPPRLKTGRGEMQVLRWPSWREKRGGIKQLAVSPDGTRVAVGGLGLITSGVAVLSRTDSTQDESVVEAYTYPKDGADHNSVTAVAFDAAGKRVAFGTADGCLWVWTPEAGQAAEKSSPTLAGKHADAKGAQAKHPLPTRPRLVYFASADTLVSVSMSGEVVECDLKGKGTKELGHLNPKGHETGRVFRAERTPDGKLAVAFMGPTARICSLDNADGIDLELGKDRMPWAVAVAADGRVAVAVGGAMEGKPGAPRFYLERTNEVWVYPAGKAVPAVKLPTSGRADAVAFHPKQKGLLAVAGGEGDEVSLFDLDGKTPAATSVSRGAGRKAFAVAIGGGNTVAVKVRPNPNATHPNDLGAGEWMGYDLARQGEVQVVAKKLSVAVNSADGWSVVPDADDRGVWYAATRRNGQEVKAALRFDHARFNDPTCYTFLPKGTEKGAVTRLLVGHALGCSLFELPDGVVPAELKPTRVYVGHSTEVLSVAADAEGTWFVTGGADMTVSAFNLTGWSADSPALGATFTADDAKDELTVKGVTVGSPAWECGLKAGDRVVRVVIGGAAKKYVYNRVIDDKLKEKVSTPTAAADALKTPEPGVEHYFEVKAAPGTDSRRLTTVPQRPVWKWFPAFDDTRITDSVVWMWKGSWYKAKSPRADELIGWHVNPPEILGSPRYYPLKRFEQLFLKPRVIDLLLQTRDVGQALAKGSALIGGLDKENPKLLQLAGKEPPRVELRVANTAVGKEAVQMTVLVGSPRKDKLLGSNVDLVPERVELWVNDYRYKTWAQKDLRGGQLTEAVAIPPEHLRAGENSLTVLTFNSGGGRGESAPRLVTNPIDPPPAALIGLTVGVNSYADHRKINAGGARGVLGDLNFAAADAKGVFDRLGEHAGKGKRFADNGLALKTDADAKKKPLLAALDALADPKNTKAARPNDVLVLFLAGHGQRLGDTAKGTELIPAGAELSDDPDDPNAAFKNVRFVFCCPDFDLNKPAAGSVAADELFDRLAAVNCRKLVFLDVCHSGGATEENVLRRLLPHGQSPFVLAACEHGQKSYENPALKHGLFTQSLLEATGDEFRRADADSDGELTCDELVKYAQRRVRTLRLTELQKTDKTSTVSDQTPVWYPEKPPGVVVAKRGG